MIYIHVPFCHRKCTYCAFYSVRSSELGVRSYLDALLDEMKRRRGEQSHPIKTVYLGGGTPSILPLQQLERIAAGLHRWFDLSRLEECTIECNPEDLTTDYLKGLKSLGLFNRLSIGIQSFDDEVLRRLNRRHTARQALDAVENAHAAGFRNISVDFIYGIHDNYQPPTAHYQLISHISAYSLTIEPHTALAAQVEQGRVVLPDEDEVARQYHLLHDALQCNGFEQYEVSNYARPGFESKHNSRYWDRTPYLGLGPGAHSLVVADGVERRCWNNPDGTVGQETLTADDAFNELLMTALRTTRGLPMSAVPDGYKKRLHIAMQPYIDCGWITLKDNNYIPTTDGLLHADGMAAALFVA